MTVNIIALGETGALWDGSGDSIGIHDCWKFGNKTDYLLVIGNTFSPERKQIILNSRPRHLITDSLQILSNFSNQQIKPTLAHKELFCTNGNQIIRYRFSKWKNELLKDRICHSYTSPFIAMGLAYLLGYKEIVLWGADFKTHRTWKEGNSMMEEVELEHYRQLTKALENKGVKVWLGATGSMLERVIEVKKVYA